MKIVDVGSGPVVVLIPGIQGRWEWMAPAVTALARSCRVITFSLADEPSGRASFSQETGFACYVDQVAAALDSAGVQAAAICGVSYGGLIAGAFAARHPARTSHLVMVSAVPPSWKPDERVVFYLRAPRLLAPLFCVGSIRMYPEIAAASGGGAHGFRMAVRHAWTVITHMFSPSRMARRVSMLGPLNLQPEFARVQRPTLIVTGEERLDRVVPTRATREYLNVWPHARLVTIDRTGHLGLITRPDAFAAVVSEFVQEPEMRRVG